MVALAAYYAAKFVLDKNAPLKFTYKLLAIFAFVAVFLALGGLDIVLDQFFRGRGGVDLSYRDILWKQNFEFISKNLLFGNHSFKYLTLLDEYGFYEHAHNSSSKCFPPWIIHLLAVRSVDSRECQTRKRAPGDAFHHSLPFQYGIFWGISFLDIIFFKLLIFGTDEKDYDRPEEL